MNESDEERDGAGLHCLWPLTDDVFYQNALDTAVFAPHHGRKSGHIPSSLMDKLTPKLVVVGEAPSDELD